MPGDEDIALQVKRINTWPCPQVAYGLLGDIELNMSFLAPPFINYLIF